MKVKPLAILSVIGSMAFFASCKHGDKSGILAPKDVAFLMHIDGASLASKLSWDDIKQTSWFKDAYSEATDSLQKKLLDNPENSGIDIKSSFAFFMKKQGSGLYFAFEGGLKDSIAFLALNKKANKEGVTSRDGDVSHMTISENASLTWNESRFIYLFSTPGIDLTSAFSHGMGGGSGTSAAFPADSLNKFGKAILDIAGGDNIASDDRFSSMMGETGDMHVWFNSSQYLNDFAGGALSMMKLSVLLDDNASATTLNFDNGKITMKMKGYYNKDMAKLMETYPMHPIGADVYNRIPSKNVAGVFAFNYPPAGLKELLKMIGVDGIVNSGLAKVNITIDDFVKANKGDLLFALSDLEIKTKEIPIPGMDGQPGATYKSNTPSAKYLFATSIADKGAFDKMTAGIKTAINEMMPNGIPDVSYSANNNWFAAGNSLDDVNKFIGGGGTQPFADKIAGHAFGAYVDLQKIIGMAGQTASSDSSAKAALDLSLKTWQDVVAYGDGGTGYAEVNFVDKSTNSLKQINQYADKMSVIVKAKNKRYENNMPAMADSAAMKVDTTAPVVH